MDKEEVDRRFKNIQLGVGYSSVVKAIDTLSNLIKKHIEDNAKTGGCNCDSRLSEIESIVCPGSVAAGYTGELWKSLDDPQKMAVLLISLSKIAELKISNESAASG